MEMNWNEIVAFILSNLLKLVAAFVIPYIVSQIVKIVKNKKHGDKIEKYVNIAANVVSQCVSYVDQIYVDSLKEDGMFNKEAQKKAFQMCWDRIVNMLNDEAKDAVIEVYGDFEEWLKGSIESSVRDMKFNFVSDLENEFVCIEKEQENG